MPLQLLNTALRGLRRPLIGWLVLAIVAYGPSSTLLQLLGPNHRHEVAALAGSNIGFQSAMVGIGEVFRDVRAWRAQLEARWLGSPVPHAHADGQAHVDTGEAVPSSMLGRAHHHAHAVFLRHHHDPTDATVVAMDVGVGVTEDGASPASAGSATLPLALATRITLPSAAVVDAAWPPMGLAGWIDAVPLPLERPPRA